MALEDSMMVLKRLSFSSLLAILALSVTAALTAGCGMGVVSIPDTPLASEQSQQVPLGTIQGSNFGGHAPLVGAHVFVVQPGTSGYGTKVSSLLTSSSANSSYPTALDSVTGSPTNGMYYVTTDVHGGFALSGDYTCTAGLPVYLYASGGNPQTIPSVTVTQINSYTDTNNKTVVVFTTSGTNLMYQGESVNFSSFSTGTSYDAFSGAQGQIVSPFYLTTNTIGFELGGNLTSMLPQGVAVNATVSQNTPIVSNPAIVNIALMGICPGSITFAGIPNGTSTNTLSGVSPADLANLAVGNVVTGPGINVATITAINTSTGTITFNQADTGGNPTGPYYTYTSTSSATKNFSYLNYLYMNEVSTVAAMYALAPFASTTANNDALHIGTSSTNLAGLQHAVQMAANLYDIQGSNVGTGGDGETHIARAVTPTNSGGTVPQTLLNTLGNLLANCVDSGNTYNAVTASSGTQSSQCQALFANATSDGTTSGTQPNDTATAAINIAHHPSGEPSGNTTFMSGLFNSITGNQPFQPTLSSAPNDFSVGIAYSGNGISLPGSVAIDASGNAWIVGYGDIVELGANGAPLSGTTGFATASGYENRGIVVDGIGNVWFITQTGTNSAYVNKMSSSGVLLSGSGYYNQSTIEPNALAVDASNNIWVANSNSAASDSYHAYVTELNGTNGNVVVTVDANPTQSTQTGPTVLLGPTGIALDGNGLMWVTGNASSNLASINTSTDVVNWYNNSNTAQPSNSPAYLAVDQNGSLWIPNQNANFIQSVVPSAATASGTANAYNVNYTEYTGGGLATTGAVAVDGANNIWVANLNQHYVSEFTNSGTPLTGTGGYAGGFGSNGGNRVAIDGSGNVWLPVPNGNNVVVMVGAAAPVITPLVTAAKNNQVAQRP